MQPTGRFIVQSCRQIGSWTFCERFENERLAWEFIEKKQMEQLFDHNDSELHLDPDEVYRVIEQKFPELQPGEEPKKPEEV